MTEEEKLLKKQLDELDRALRAMGTTTAMKKWLKAWRAHGRISNLA